MYVLLYMESKNNNQALKRLVVMRNGNGGMWGERNEWRGSKGLKIKQKRDTAFHTLTYLAWKSHKTYLYM